jgi:hypothetical protein
MDDWKKQLDLLVEETLLFIRSVGSDASRKIVFPQTVAPPESQGVVRTARTCETAPGSRSLVPKGQIGQGRRRDS